MRGACHAMEVCVKPRAAPFAPSILAWATPVARCLISDKSRFPSSFVPGRISSWRPGHPNQQRIPGPNPRPYLRSDTHPEP